MSIGIYAFLSIYFLSFGLSAFAQFRTHCAGSSAPAAVPIVPARLVWYRVQTGAACPASGRVCRCVAWSALLPALCRLSGCAGGCGLHRRGIWGEPGVGQVMPAIKFFKEKGVFEIPLTNIHPTFTKRNVFHCAIFQIFRKIQKGPSRSLDCGIIS